MPVVKAIAYNFVTERCPGEVMALGINSIREMAKRIPALLEEEGMDSLVVVRNRQCFALCYIYCAFNQKICPIPFLVLRIVVGEYGVLTFNRALCKAASTVRLLILPSTGCRIAPNGMETYVRTYFW